MTSRAFGLSARGHWVGGQGGGGVLGIGNLEDRRSQHRQSPGIQVERMSFDIRARLP